MFLFVIVWNVWGEVCQEFAGDGAQLLHNTDPGYRKLLNKYIYKIIEDLVFVFTKI